MSQFHSQRISYFGNQFKYQFVLISTIRFVSRRIGLLIQAVIGMSQTPAPQHGDHVRLPTLISKEVEASEVIKCLRVLKLVALHSSGSGGDVLAVGTPQKSQIFEDQETPVSSDIELMDDARPSSDGRKITEEVQTRNQPNSTSVGCTPDIPPLVRSFLLTLGHNGPTSTQSPLQLSVSVILQSYRSLESHISKAASHALGVVTRHLAQTRRRTRNLLECSKEPIKLSDLLHPSLLMPPVNEIFTVSQCRSSGHFEVGSSPNSQNHIIPIPCLSNVIYDSL